MSGEPKRWKRGDIRPDGRVFWNYFPNGNEYWVNRNTFDHLKARIKISRNKKERKERQRLQKKEYNSRPEIKAARSEYRKKKYADPVFRRKLKEYQNRPEVIAKRKNYAIKSNSRPELRERRKNQYQEWKKSLDHESLRIFLKFKREKKRKNDAEKRKDQSARNYMTALLAAQQLSEAMKNKQPQDNENTK